MCAIEDCESISYIKGFCRKHYDSQRKAKLGSCSIDSCERNQNSRGLCTRHYIALLGEDKPLCTNPGCNHKQYVTTSTYCKYHYDLDVGITLFKKYGINVEDFNQMMEEQDHRCAICRITIDQAPMKRYKRFCVDHDHATGAVRGLLCSKCNFGIGNFNDDVSLLHNAIKYLEKYK